MFISGAGPDPAGRCPSNTAAATGMIYIYDDINNIYYILNTCKFGDDESMKLYKVNFILKIAGRRK